MWPRDAWRTHLWLKGPGSSPWQHSNRRRGMLPPWEGRWYPFGTRRSLCIETDLNTRLLLDYGQVPSRSYGSCDHSEALRIRGASTSLLGIQPARTRLGRHCTAGVGKAEPSVFGTHRLVSAFGLSMDDFYFGWTHVHADRLKRAD